MPSVSSPDNRVSVLINQALPKTLTYRVGGDPAPEGALVRVPLGNKQGFGVVLGPSEENIPEEKLKSIAAVLELPSLKKSLIDFIFWVADYTMSPPGSVLAMALGGQSVLAAKKPRAKKEAEAVSPPPEKHALGAAQKSAADTLVGDVKDAKFSVTLLDGVTGSGKTEVYCEAIEAAMAESKQSLVLLPEIALTTQLVERLTRRFGFAPVLWHSGLTPATRRDCWKAVAEGTAKLVVGARSALFLPYARLGVIVVDEEHDGSYKQEDGVVYHARDMAVVRGKEENIPVVLSSATPSLETVLNVRAGRYRHLHLPERHGVAVMPHIHLVDLRHEKMPRGGWISPTLQKALRETLQRKEQALLFLNRRGYAPLTLCRKCGHRFACPQCSAWLVEHRTEGKQRLVCHHCGHAMLYPKACTECHAEDSLAACGPGVERLKEEAQKLFPNARIAVLASDTQEHIDALRQTVAAMENGEIDILIGTQIVAKGYHFPGLTLVGVIDGDLGLQGGDLRAAEHTFQLLAQVAGRSGRVDIHGHVYIQTVQPQHAVMQNLAQYDRDQLVETLIREREKYAMPPFARLAIVTLSGTNPAQTKEAAQKLAQNIPSVQAVEVLGPAPAPMALLRGRFRLRFLVKTGRSQKIQDFIRGWLSLVKISPIIRIGIDIDPQHFS
ncbi:MAG: primosomal protein N' [Proteobacteria bacterium]|nr:primosomal protein N' [Pseudomonadota bacterium]